MIFALIMSGLALLAAICCVVVTAQNEKRNKKRNTALIRYVQKTAEGLAKKYDQRLDSLEKGIMPDYEQAKAAAAAVNDFSKGITNILGFDPMEALKTDRQKKEMGDVE